MAPETMTLKVPAQTRDLLAVAPGPAVSILHRSSQPDRPRYLVRVKVVRSCLALKVWERCRIQGVRGRRPGDALCPAKLVDVPLEIIRGIRSIPANAQR